jgi:transcriptional regulator of aromatic amino acid metabolism
MNLLPTASAATSLHPLLDLLSDAVLVLDLEGRISFANAAALR